MKRAFPTPESLKSFIGVSIVSGDHQYHSINPSAKRVIKLLLEDGHFRVHQDQASYQLRNISLVGEKPAIAYKYIDENSAEVYIKGKKPIVKSRKWLVKQKKTYAYSSAYTCIKCEGDESLKDTYDKFVKEATAIKEMTGGRINKFETRESLHRADEVMGYVQQGVLRSKELFQKLWGFLGKLSKRINHCNAKLVKEIDNGEHKVAFKDIDFELDCGYQHLSFKSY
ncbi:hypothetical protein DLAC_04123 [Tieghemostelium lacteum]|uniref:Uncharacterized protein n=1 Tax=Tieghemostelium lacteum TaxID=361077 RepID=A0A151ZSB9_TIELA|nr:hypothetical protein DLAC_04123 [Tieghemostelium lacteum]|eukprot:KYQ96819.1 hypothetical protein DLAC_04123 [Tieghemostelium lacteum]